MKTESDVLWSKPFVHQSISSNLSTIKLEPNAIFQNTFSSTLILKASNFEQHYTEIWSLESYWSRVCIGKFIV